MGWADPERRAATIGLVVAAVVLAFFLVLDIGFHARYVQAGHYFAAVPMFAALTAVVVINALRSEHATVTMGAGPSTGATPPSLSGWASSSSRRACTSR